MTKTEDEALSWPGRAMFLAGLLIGVICGGIIGAISTNFLSPRTNLDDSAKFVATEKELEKTTSELMAANIELTSYKHLIRGLSHSLEAYYRGEDCPAIDPLSDSLQICTGTLSPTSAEKYQFCLNEVNEISTRIGVQHPSEPEFKDAGSVVPMGISVYSR